ncbi:hypothetical protein PVAP13_3NG178483 [Panicum virgatum]|uniref:Uncharacterized protein n=1 Tax=Panicum virgatum TaxID=38727 RepID=A0A8T0U7W0_PANVG|nr:hypothetical protein PVAP13_3NG178483 [Panicum virgatum]
MHSAGPTPSPLYPGRAAPLYALKCADTRRRACRRPQVHQAGDGAARDKELVEIEQQGGRESSWSRRDGGESRKHGRGTGRA